MPRKVARREANRAAELARGRQRSEKFEHLIGRLRVAVDKLCIGLAQTRPGCAPAEQATNVANLQKDAEPRSFASFSTDHMQLDTESRLGSADADEDGVGTDCKLPGGGSREGSAAQASAASHRSDEVA